jgi:peptidase E
MLKPVYLLGSGPGAHRGALRRLMRQALGEAGKPAPVVAYIGAASGDNRMFLRMISDFLRDAGAGDVCLAPTAGRRTDPGQTREILAGADLVFVSGGDVEEGMRVLGEQKLIEILRKLYNAGIPFLGASAGSIMLARQWVRWADANDDDSAEAFDCLGLAPVLCDTHAEDDDWEELKALLRLVEPGVIGYGIPTNGALSVQPNGNVAAFGEPVVRFRNQTGTVRRLADLTPEA